MDEQIIEISNKSGQSGGPTIQNGEYLLRMQFLLQATEIVEDPLLNRFYASEIKNIAKRQVLRIDPAIKGLFCKRCNSKLDQEKSFSRLTGSSKNKHSKIECPFCLYQNKVYNQFKGKVNILVNDKDQ